MIVNGEETDKDVDKMTTVKEWMDSVKAKLFKEKETVPSAPPEHLGRTSRKEKAGVPPGISLNSEGDLGKGRKGGSQNVYLGDERIGIS